MNFVERVAAKVHGGGSKGGSDAFDPVKLKESFEDTIKSLQNLMKETEARMSFLEKECAEEEKKHKKKSQSVEDQFKVCHLQRETIITMQLAAKFSQDGKATQ